MLNRVNPFSGLTLAGNTSGTLAPLSSGTITFAGGNNITLSQVGNAVTISGANAGGAQTGISGIVAGGATVSSGTVVFSNSNGVSFGLNGSTITGSVAGQTNQTGNVYAGSNTFGTSSGTYDARTLSLIGSGAVSVAGSNSGWVISAPVQTAQTQSVVAGIYDGAASISTGTVRVSNSNGVTFGINGQTLTASVNTSYLGSNASTNYVQAGAAFNGTNVSGTVASGAVSVSVAAQSIQSQNLCDISLAGNTSGVLALVSSGTAVFAGGNNITLSQVGNNITISGANAGGAQTGISGIAGGGATATSGTVVFSNSNGVSFGVNGQTLTASVSAQTAQTVGLYAVGNTTQNSSTTLDARTLSFNALGLATMGFSNGSIQVSVTQTVQTQNLHDVTLAGNSTSAGAGYILISSGTMVLAGGNNITLSQNGQSITISGPNAGGAQTGISSIIVSNTTYTSGAVSFSNANGISFGSSAGQAITASYTVPTQSVQTQNCVDVTLGGNTAGVLALVSSGTLFLAGGNNVTLSQNGQSVTISGANAGGAQTGISGIAGGGATATSGTVVFSNSNGVSFGVNGQTLTASVVAQTNQTLGLYATGNTTQNSSTTLDARTLSFNAIGGATMGYSNGSIQMSVPATSSLSATGFASISVNVSTISIGATYTANLYASSNTFGTSSGTGDPRSISIAGSGGISVAASNSGWVISCATQTVQTQNCVDVSLSGNTSGVLALVSSGTLILAGGANVTLSQNGQSVTISAGTAAAAPVNFSAGTTSSNIGSVVFSNSNGVSFGLNGSTITGSVAAQTVQTQNCVDVTIGGNSTSAGAGYILVSSGTLFLAGGNNVTLSQNGQSVTISGANAGGAQTGISGIAVAGATATSGTVLFSNSNGVTFGLNGNTITASVAGGGGNVNFSAGTTSSNLASVVFSNSNNISFGLNGATITASVQGTNSLYAQGNTSGTSNGSWAGSSLAISGGIGIVVAGSNAGWNVAQQIQSVSEPFPILSGTTYSGNFSASFTFNRVVINAPLAVSNINLVKQLVAGIPGATSQNSSGSEAFSWQHGITVFSRQNYGTGSSNFTTVATASVGVTAQMSYSSSTQSLSLSWVTDSTGGFSSISTVSASNGYSGSIQGNKIVAVPLVTTFAPGEYFFCHRILGTYATLGSNASIFSVNNLIIIPQTAGNLGFLGGTGPISGVGPWGYGAGIATAITTNNTMPASVITIATQHNHYMAMSNV